MVTLSIGAPGAESLTTVMARPRGSAQSAAGEAEVTGLMRSLVRSRRASSAPKNSVFASHRPVPAAQMRKIVAGKATQRCHLRQKAVFQFMLSKRMTDIHR